MIGSIGMNGSGADPAVDQVAAADGICLLDSQTHLTGGPKRRHPELETTGE